MGKVRNKENIHWKIWDILTRSKEAGGGLGFRELHIFNKAILTKMDARVLEETTSLSVQVLKGLYFLRGDFLLATKWTHASWGWSSLLVDRDTIQREGIWRIGKGLYIQVHKDPCLCTKTGVRTGETPEKDNNAVVFVRSLIVMNKQSNKDQVWQYMTTSDAEFIIRIPIPITEEPDKLVWAYTKDREAKVWSVYHRLMEIAKGLAPTTLTDGSRPKNLCSGIWSAHTIPKTKAMCGSYLPMQ